MTRAVIAAAFLALIVVIAGGAYTMGKRAFNDGPHWEILW